MKTENQLIFERYVKSIKESDDQLDLTNPADAMKYYMSTQPKKISSRIDNEQKLINAIKKAKQQMLSTGESEIGPFYNDDDVIVAKMFIALGSKTGIDTREITEFINALTQNTGDESTPPFSVYEAIISSLLTQYGINQVEVSSDVGGQGTSEDQWWINLNSM